MRAALILALTILLTPAIWSADCPPPKPLTCKQLTALLPYRCAQGEIDALSSHPAEPPMRQDMGIGQCAVCPQACPDTRCTGASTEDVTRAIAAYYREPALVNVYIPRDHGVPLVSGSVGYFAGATIDFGAGWRFRNGWDVIGSATWGNLSGHDTYSYAYGRDPDDGNHGHDEDYAPPSVAYTVTDDSHRSTWGGRISLTVPLRCGTHKR